MASSSSKSLASGRAAKIPTQDDPKSLVLVGGTGSLGQELAPGLRTAPGFQHFIALVRSSTSSAAQTLQQQGWTLQVISNDDWTTNYQQQQEQQQPPTLASQTLVQALTGVFAVVSALSGPHLVTLEQALVDAAIQANVTLLVPSQYGVDQRRWQRQPQAHAQGVASLFPAYQRKRQVLEYYHQRRLEQNKNIILSILYVACGLFADVIFESMLVDVQSQSALIVEDGHPRYSFTRRSDVGYVLAQALHDPQYHTPVTVTVDDALQSCHFLSMAGTTLSLRDALDLFATYSGIPLTITSISLAESQARERALLEAYHTDPQTNTDALYQAFHVHILNRPILGDTGMDTSSSNDDADERRHGQPDKNNYGIALEPLQETFRKRYGDVMANKSMASI